MVTNSARVTAEDRFRLPWLSTARMPRARTVSRAVDWLTAPAGRVSMDTARAAANRAESFFLMGDTPFRD